MWVKIKLWLRYILNSTNKVYNNIILILFYYKKTHIYLQTLYENSVTHTHTHTIFRSIIYVQLSFYPIVNLLKCLKMVMLIVCKSILVLLHTIQFFISTILIKYCNHTHFNYLLKFFVYVTWILFIQFFFSLYMYNVNFVRIWRYIWWKYAMIKIYNRLRILCAQEIFFNCCFSAKMF